MRIFTMLVSKLRGFEKGACLAVKLHAHWALTRESQVVSQ